MLVEKLLSKGIIISALVESNATDELKEMKFCITGTLSRKRSEIVDFIKSKGGEVSSSVSSKTSFLVTNDEESSSSKFTKAKKMNIPIISDEDLFNLKLD